MTDPEQMTQFQISTAICVGIYRKLYSLGMSQRCARSKTVGIDRTAMIIAFIITALAVASSAPLLRSIQTEIFAEANGHVVKDKFAGLGKLWRSWLRKAFCILLAFSLY